MILRRNLWLLLLSLLVACGRGEHDVERLLAAAEQAEKAGQLTVAAELYYWAAALQPEAFDPQYRAALLDLRLRG